FLLDRLLGQINRPHATGAKQAQDSIAAHCLRYSGADDGRSFIGRQRSFPTLVSERLANRMVSDGRACRQWVSAVATESRRLAAIFQDVAAVAADSLHRSLSPLPSCAGHIPL